MDEVDSKLARMNDKFNDKLNKLDKLDELDSKLRNTASANSLAVKQLDSRLNICEQSVKNNSLRFYGLKENDNENVPELISSFVTSALKIPCCMTDINFAFRIDLTKERYKILLAAKEKYGKDKVWTTGGRIYFLKDGKKLLYTPNDE
ncbi:hypothetical protein NQ317_002934 [Molorchus minor]|uniref:Uncharacterized protein n=1 Tax=Molorchus minor TaxID=1323400 RepID=A0ABQ9ISA2_9CUCU|nr:hypothetical protein NQ317_002934 [Molorchus minor]